MRPAASAPRGSASAAVTAAAAAAAGKGGLMRWNSPVPYVFLGMGVVLSLIAVALIVLVCSHRKSDEEEEEEYASSAKALETVIDVEPRILVVMAGENRPTCLAKPSHIILSPCPNCTVQTVPIEEA